MDAFASSLNIESKQFAANAEHHRALAAELRNHIETARAGGGSAARKRHEARGKLFVRERIERLLDPGAPFLELSPLAANGLYDDLTENAVRRFQEAKHITIDGVVGPITQILLYNSLGRFDRPTLAPVPEIPATRVQEKT